MSAPLRSPAPPVARLSDVDFSYPGAAEPTLVGVDLTLSPQDFVGLIGPNGGGKTTLLKLLLGLLEPRSGTIEVFGAAPGTVRRRVGYVPQSAAIDPTAPATVLDVVLMGRLSRSSWGFRFAAADRAAALAALDRTGTTELAGRRLATLSGGQRQRVLIARALAGEPDLLLLDEPTAGVDLHRERELLTLLRNLNEHLPIVMVSHDVVLVSSHMDRAVWVNREVVSLAASEVTVATVEAMYHHQGCGHGHDQVAGS